MLPNIEAVLLGMTAGGVMDFSVWFGESGGVMKKMLAFSVLILVPALAGISAEDSGGDKMDYKAIVDDLGNRAEKCFLSGDIDGMLQYYCDDVVSMPNFHPMVKGKSNLRRMTRAIFASGMKFESLESTTLEVKGDGDFVYEIGIFKQSVVMPGAGKAVRQSGKYLTVWRKQSGGGLKIAVEMYNSDELR